jgi:hypothetical protein
LDKRKQNNYRHTSNQFFYMVVQLEPPTGNMEKHVESTEIWFIQRIMRIPRAAIKTNAEIDINVSKLTKTYYCRQEKTGNIYCSYSSKGEAQARHRLNRKKYLENETKEDNEKR